MPAIPVLAAFALAAPIGVSFSTTFAAAENPISESGIWQTTDASNFSTWNFAPFTSGGNAFGHASASGSNDSVAFLKPSVGIRPTQTATAVLFYNGSGFGSAECEIHLRSTWDATQLFTYEFDLVFPSHFAAIVVWNAAQGTFGSLPLTNGTSGTITGPTDGDVFEAAVTGLGSVVTLTLKQNGTLVAQADDSATIRNGIPNIAGTNPFLSGSAGIGFDNGGAQNQNVGWASFSIVST